MKFLDWRLWAIQTWHPKRRENRLNIGPKIGQFYDASWNRFCFLDFSLIFGAKNRAMLDRKCIQKSILSLKGLKARKDYKTNVNLI